VYDQLPTRRCVPCATRNQWPDDGCVGKYSWGTCNCLGPTLAFILHITHCSALPAAARSWCLVWLTQHRAYGLCQPLTRDSAFMEWLQESQIRAVTGRL